MYCDSKVISRKLVRGGRKRDRTGFGGKFGFAESALENETWLMSMGEKAQCRGEPGIIYDNERRADSICETWLAFLVTNSS